MASRLSQHQFTIAATEHRYIPCWKPDTISNMFLRSWRSDGAHSEDYAAPVVVQDGWVRRITDSVPES